MVKLACVNEDFVSTMTFLEPKDEPSIAVKETLVKTVMPIVSI